MGDDQEAIWGDLRFERDGGDQGVYWHSNYGSSTVKLKEALKKKEEEEEKSAFIDYRLSPMVKIDSNKLISQSYVTKKYSGID